MGLGLGGWLRVFWFFLFLYGWFGGKVRCEVVVGVFCGVEWVIFGFGVRLG